MMPKALVALVIDADAHLIDGEADQPVELEGHVWAEIRAAADREDRREPPVYGDVLGFVAHLDTEAKNDVIALRARVVELEAGTSKWAQADSKMARELVQLRDSTARDVDELRALREFKAAVVRQMGVREWASDTHLILAVGSCWRDAAALAGRVAEEQDAADQEDSIAIDTHAELTALREFKAASFSIERQQQLSDFAKRDLQVERAELVLLREFKAADDKRRESFTFSKIAPEITAWATQLDGKGTDPSRRDVNVRLLLEGGEGCVIGFQEARDVAREILSKIDVALFPVAAENKKKHAADARVCGLCEETGHAATDCGTRPAEFNPLPPKKTPSPAEGSLQIDFTKDLAKPNRRTKKFPLNSGLTERCTKCHRTQGAHVGTKCPKEAHGDHSDDFDADGKLIEVAS